MLWQTPTLWSEDNMSGIKNPIISSIAASAFPITGLTQNTFQALRLFVPSPAYCFSNTSGTTRSVQDGPVALWRDVSNVGVKNLILNPMMTGAIIGTSGTAPLNWSWFNSASGITRQIISVGSESVDGQTVNYMDIRISGTATSNGTVGIDPTPIQGVAASNGQRWCGSVYVKLITGTISNLGLIIAGVDNSSSILFTKTTNMTGANSSTYTRYIASDTFSNENISYSSLFIRSTITSGQVIDFTVRIAAPQLEVGVLNPSTFGYSLSAFQATAGFQPKLRKGAKNWLANSTMQGAVIGTPGTIPTGWNQNTPAGVTRQITAIGTESINEVDVNFIEVRYSGTATASGSIVFDPISNNQLLAVTGQSWVFSAYLKLVSGTLPSGGVIGINERNSGGTSLAGSGTVLTSISSTYQRFVVSRVLNQATTSMITAQIRVDPINSGNTVDFTLRIAAPQLELGVATPSAYAPTSGSPASNGVGNWWLDFDGVQTRMDFTSINFNQTTPFYFGYSGTSYSASQWQSAIGFGGADPVIYSSVGITNIGRGRVVLADSAGAVRAAVTADIESFLPRTSTYEYTPSTLYLRTNGVRKVSIGVPTPAASTYERGVIGGLKRNNTYSDFFYGQIYGVFMIQGNIVPDSELLLSEKYLGRLQGLVI